MRQVTQTARMEVEKIDIRCPTKPNTHANKFIRSANRQIVPWKTETSDSHQTLMRKKGICKRDKFRQGQRERGSWDIFFERIYTNRELKRVSIEGRSDQDKHQWISQVLQIPRHWAEAREPHGWMVDQKLVATTVSSRRRKTGNQGENKTTSSFVHKSSVTTAEGEDKAVEEELFDTPHSDVPLCILRSRSTSTSLQHDPQPTTYEHDASNTNTPLYDNNRRRKWAAAKSVRPQKKRKGRGTEQQQNRAREM